MLDDGFFQINDIVFNVPPTEIKVLRNSSDHRLENLRTVGASVLKSNFSELNIQVAAVFTDQGSEMIYDHSSNTSETEWKHYGKTIVKRPVSYTHLTLPTTPYV